jgi:hypothetical protein
MCNGRLDLKYRQTPLYTELTLVSDEKLRRDALGIYTRELFRTKGFQIVVQILRDLEETALKQLRRGKGGERQLGVLETVDAVRSSLLACLPEVEQGKVDFYDDEDEGLILDTSVTPGSSE